MRFLEEGFAPSFFWGLSLQEAYEVLASHAKKQRETMKAEALMKYIQSLQIAECIAKTKDIKNDKVETVKPYGAETMPMSTEKVDRFGDYAATHVG